MRRGTRSLTFSLIFLAGVSLGRTSGRVGQKRFSSKRFTPARSRRGGTTTWATPAPTFDRRDTDLWETRKTCSLLSSPVFLLPSIGQLIHLEARRGVRAERGSIDQEVHLPFVCVVYLRLRVRFRAPLYPLKSSDQSVLTAAARQRWPFASRVPSLPSLLPGLSEHFTSFSSFSSHLRLSTFSPRSPLIPPPIPLPVRRPSLFSRPLRLICLISPSAAPPPQPPRLSCQKPERGRGRMTALWLCRIRRPLAFQ